MCFGIWQEYLVVRSDPATAQKQLQREHVRPFDVTGRPMKGWLMVSGQGRPVYLNQATMDTRPEDLIVTPVIGPTGGIQYAASSLVSAMLTGGVLILDEGNRRV